MDGNENFQTQWTTMKALLKRKKKKKEVKAITKVED